jgi:hypothetical protein
METNKNANTVGDVSNEELFYWFEDGNKQKIKIVNLNNPENCPRKGVIELEAIKKKDFDRLRDSHFTISCAKDKNTGIYWGIPSGINPRTGNVNWMPIDLGMLNIFDLTVPSEAEKCAIILHSNIVEGSPNANYKTTYFRVHDKEKAAMLKIKRVKDSRRAIDLASSLYGESLVNMARNLNISVDSMSVAMLEAEVLEAAEKRPAEFLQIYDNPNYENITILNRAMATGVIEHDLRSGYLFRGAPLGSTEGQVLDYLLNHRDVASTIDYQAKARESESIKSMEKSTANVISEADKDAEIALLKKQLKDQKSEIERLATDKIHESITDDLNESDDVKELKAEANKLGIKAVHAYKKPDAIEKLRKLVAEKKATEV